MSEKNIIFTRPHKTIYEQDGKVVKVFDQNYTLSSVLNEAKNEALVQENTDLNVPKVLAVTKEEGRTSRKIR